MICFRPFSFYPPVAFQIVKDGEYSALARFDILEYQLQF